MCHETTFVVEIVVFTLITDTMICNAKFDIQCQKAK